MYLPTAVQYSCGFRYFNAVINIIQLYRYLGTGRSILNLVDSSILATAVHIAVIFRSRDSGNHHTIFSYNPPYNPGYDTHHPKNTCRNKYVTQKTLRKSHGKSIGFPKPYRLTSRKPDREISFRM